MRHIFVTLTATTNPYLQERLPLRGFLEIFETTTVNTISQAVFRGLNVEGTSITAPVSVPGFQFAYTGERPTPEVLDSFHRNQGIGVWRRRDGGEAMPTTVGALIDVTTTDPQGGMNLGHSLELRESADGATWWNEGMRATFDPAEHDVLDWRPRNVEAARR